MYTPVTEQRCGSMLGKLTGHCIGGAFLLAGGAAFAADMPAAAPAAKVTPFFVFSDTILEYRQEFSATDAGFPHTFPKEIANLTHVDAYKYGTNFVSVDVLSSTNADPAAPATTSYTGMGSREVYFIYRGTLSGNAVTNSKRFKFGFIKDISLEYGTDLESQNTAFAPQTAKFLVGPQISFDVPGFLTIAAHFDKEWDHNGLAAAGGAVGGLTGLPANSDFDPRSGRVSFRPTAEFEVTYLQPLQPYVKLPLVFTGFTNVVMPKGKDGFSNNTHTELLTSNRLSLDVGSYFNHPKFIDVFVGYKFWMNKFGNISQYGNPAFTTGSVESTVFTGIDFHLQ